MSQAVQVDVSDAVLAADRLQAVLDSGHWPSGIDVLPYERPVIEKNIEFMLRVTVSRVRLPALPATDTP